MCNTSFQQLCLDLIYGYDTQMEEIRGKAEDTTRYVYGGYQYHVDSTSIHLFRYSTRSSTRCRGTARVDEGGHVEVYKPPDCAEPNETILEELQMQREMLNLATETQAPLKEIFDAVCRRFFKILSIKYTII